MSNETCKTIVANNSSLIVKNDYFFKKFNKNEFVYNQIFRLTSVRFLDEP